MQRRPGCQACGDSEPNGPARVDWPATIFLSAGLILATAGLLKVLGKLQS